MAEGGGDTADGSDTAPATGEKTCRKGWVPDADQEVDLWNKQSSAWIPGKVRYWSSMLEEHSSRIYRDSWTNSEQFCEHAESDVAYPTVQIVAAEDESLLLLWDDRCTPSLPSVLFPFFIRLRKAWVGDIATEGERTLQQAARLRSTQGGRGSEAQRATDAGVQELCKQLADALFGILKSKDFADDARALGIDAQNLGAVDRASLGLVEMAARLAATDAGAAAFTSSRPTAASVLLRPSADPLDRLRAMPVLLRMFV